MTEAKRPLRTLISAMLALLLTLATGFGTASVASGELPASKKWVGPKMPGPMGGQSQTTIYYGPWRCSQAFMNYCQSKCTAEGHKLMGCIWLADIKTDWQSRFLGSPLRIAAAIIQWLRTLRTGEPSGMATIFATWATEENRLPSATFYLCPLRHTTNSRMHTPLAIQGRVAGNWWGLIGPTWIEDHADSANACGDLT
jgi:hypothetical protein